MKHDAEFDNLPPEQALVSQAYRGLTPLARDLSRLETALDHLQVAGGKDHAEQIRALRQQLRSFEPSVTLIGQVKAGKTSLANAMAGKLGLLPSDINPWTSVVTSMHLSPRRSEANQKARFRFFTDAQWANLLTTGGRVGELASRAGADQELEKVRRQLDSMRSAARARLGEQFEMLLGQTHDYGYVDAELVQRYVCLGDEEDGAEGQGRFADITRAADLAICQPALPLSLCLRDTPGVNDTFMVREQITVNAIRGSKLCVVVLSAHQALSNVDLALVRLIANVPARDVIIFVNRVDELTDPARDIPEIRASIEATLKSLSIPAEAEILFGSAQWANAALSAELGRMGRDSAEALLNWARFKANTGDLEKDTTRMVWELSGLPELGRAMAERITAGEGAAVLARVASAARNIAGAIAAAQAVADRRQVERRLDPVDPAALAKSVEAITAEGRRELEKTCAALTADLDLRLAKAQETFTSRATTALVRHLESYGEDIEWTYEPSGLRLLLKSGYNVFCAKSHRAAAKVFTDTSTALQTLFEEVFGLSHSGFALEAPVVPDAPVPVMLGQTIALDIKGSWWSRWWRRKRDYTAYADEFRSLIEAEVAPMAATLADDHAYPHADALRAVLNTFVAEQCNVLMGLAAHTTSDLDQMRRDQVHASAAQSDALSAAHSILTDFPMNQHEGRP
ncbi:dynamin family protein [Gymnodinialimonas ulvae]|uniref:dynamin family protein n=1 Tax=Gymnodinialimonas ulvae TaxID=3126504 RepID=UPI003099AF84